MKTPLEQALTREQEIDINLKDIALSSYALAINKLQQEKK